MARLFTLSVLLFVAPHLIISKAVASDGGEEHHGEERVLHGRDLVRRGKARSKTKLDCCWLGATFYWFFRCCCRYLRFSWFWH